MDTLKTFLIAWLVIINAAAFGLMLADKRKAVNHRWRIPESKLLLAAALGGSLGEWIGMYLFRHKTHHPKFYLGVPAMLLAQVLLAVVIQKIF